LFITISTYNHETEISCQETDALLYIDSFASIIERTPDI